MFLLLPFVEVFFVIASPKDSPPRLQFRHTPLRWIYALWKFWRPHTVIGTSLSVLGLAAIVLAGLDSPALPIREGLMPSIGVALVACLLGNLYIVGLNQLEDVAIDQINKPHLPLASGEFSLADGRWIVALAGLGSFGLALVGGPWLLATVGLSLVIGTAYSLPPLRLKRFPFWASFCILAVRGAVVNLGLFLHFSERLGQPLTIPGRVWALTAFILLFSIAIALFKDIPDIEGDRRYGIRTFSVNLGQRPVFNLARGMLTLCYVGIVLVAPWLHGVNRPLLMSTHLVALAALWIASFRVAPLYPNSPRATLSYPNFYQFIWKLFFLQYLIFPLACWLA
ncbi:homogentisate phytyltransferase [Phormidium sp. FACHB-1136]|uniref:homogentisate phytyltransferase n=1 Tax=Phormidium sp. FACHB-1136 TaxID=2692848 RepID=UPI0032207FC8